jgi:hypothetical protein
MRVINLRLIKFNDRCAAEKLKLLPRGDVLVRAGKLQVASWIACSERLRGVVDERKHDFLHRIYVELCTDIHRFCLGRDEVHTQIVGA